MMCRQCLLVTDWQWQSWLLIRDLKGRVLSIIIPRTSPNSIQRQGFYWESAYGFHKWVIIYSNETGESWNYSRSVFLLIFNFTSFFPHFCFYICFLKLSSWKRPFPSQKIKYPVHKIPQNMLFFYVKTINRAGHLWDRQVADTVFLYLLCLTIMELGYY